MGAKKRLLSLLFLVCAVLISCNKEDDIYPLDTVFNVEFESDSEYLVADGTSTAHFKIGIYNNKGHIIESLTERTLIRYRGEIVAQGTTIFDFTPTSSGGHRFLFEFDGKIIDNQVIYAIEGNQRATIPVIFHVSESESGDISQKASQVLEALNDKFNNLDVHPLVEDNKRTQIRFELATADPQNIPLEEIGISRYPQTHELFRGFVEEWQRDYYWNPDFYINVWIGKKPPQGSFVRRTHSPTRYSYRIPKDTLPDPSWSYRTDHGSTPPTHQPEGVKFTYRDNIEELVSSYELNFLTLCFGKFLGLEILNNPREDLYNYMRYVGNVDTESDHFTTGQNGRMWFILNFARWRAREGVEFTDID